jgi:hypothetical protein
MYMNLLTFTLQRYVDAKSDKGIVSQDRDEGVSLLKAIPGSPFSASKFLRQEVYLELQSGAGFVGAFA